MHLNFLHVSSWLHNSLINWWIISHCLEVSQFILSIHLLKDSFIAPKFWELWIKLLYTPCVTFYLDTFYLNHLLDISLFHKSINSLQLETMFLLITSDKQRARPCIHSIILHSFIQSTPNVPYNRQQKQTKTVSWLWRLTLKWTKIKDVVFYSIAINA